MLLLKSTNKPQLPPLYLVRCLEQLFQMFTFFLLRFMRYLSHEENSSTTSKRQRKIGRMCFSPINGIRSFRYKVVSIQVDSIQTEVVSIHVKSRFGTVEVDSIQTTGRIEKKRVCETFKIVEFNAHWSATL